MRFFNKQFFFRVILLFSLLILYLCISAVSYANIISSDLSSSVFRLHVIANSDTDEDQTLKLKVRDALLSYMNSLLESTSSKDEAMEIANNHLQDFELIALNVINSEGYDYSVDISIDKCDFPTKSYGDVTLPAGVYDALRVKIGKADGHNWWCVMFPPLCFVDVSSGIVPDTSKEVLKDSLDNEEYKIITADNSSANNSSIKLKIVEIVHGLKSKI